MPTVIGPLLPIQYSEGEEGGVHSFCCANTANGTQYILNITMTPSGRLIMSILHHASTLQRWRSMLWFQKKKRCTISGDAFVGKLQQDAKDRGSRNCLVLEKAAIARSYAPLFRKRENAALAAFLCGSISYNTHLSSTCPSLYPLTR